MPYPLNEILPCLVDKETKKHFVDKVSMKNLKKICPTPSKRYRFVSLSTREIGCQRALVVSRWRYCTYMQMIGRSLCQGGA